MKKKAQGRRILSRRMAKTMNRTELQKANGGAMAGVGTWSTSNPPDRDPVKSKGPVYV